MQRGRKGTGATRPAERVWAMRLAAFVVMAAGVFGIAQQRGEAASQYTLSSNAAGTGQINVDDDLIVYLNGAIIYDDTTDPTGAGLRNPIQFSANVGDTLRIVVKDTFGGCAALSDLYLTDANGAKLIAPGFDLGCGRGNGDLGTVYDTSIAVPLLNGIDVSVGPAGRPLPGSTTSGVIVGPNGRLYGVTYNGGAYGKGTIFSSGPDLADPQVLYSFSNGADGRNPEADLIVGTGAYQNVLFGAAKGGVSGGGVVFKFDVSTSTFTVVTSLGQGFGGQPGGPPWGPLLLVGDTLFGPTYADIFRVNTDGTGFEYIRSFSFEEGQNLQALTLASDGRLLGTAAYGGDTTCDPIGCGTFYSMDQDGGNFALHQTLSVRNQGFPSRMTSDGTWYYGTWFRGLYRRDATATVAEQVYGERFFPPSFAAARVGSNGRIYWTTYGGGLTGSGTVISVKKDGTDFRTEVDLDGTAGFGIASTPAQLGAKVYVTAEYDARTNYTTGTIFAVPITSGDNTPPVANPLSITTDEDTSVPVTLSGTDADNDPLTFQVVAQPLHGTLTGTAPALTYVPQANYNGADSFTYRANDGTADSADVTVDITVTPVNDAPTITGDAIQTDEDTPLTFTPSVADVENDALTLAVVDAPVYGQLELLAGGMVKYTPNANYYGNDAFSLKVNDGQADSAVPANFSVTVNAVNDVPVANAQSVTVAEDAIPGIDITLTGSDIDSTTLFYNVQTGPSHGTLTFPSAQVVRYQPAANYNGPDSFTFTVGDGQGSSTPATVSITVTPVPDKPVALAQSLTTGNTTPLPIVLGGTDVDNDPLTYAIVTAPAHGTLSLIAGTNVTYTPSAGYAGLDSFTFKANDGGLDSDPATIQISVTSTNRAPSAVSTTINVVEDTPTAPFALGGTDPDNDPLTFTIVTNPAHGSISGTFPGALVYTPAANYNGQDQLTFKVNDGQADSGVATITFLIAAVPDTPVAVGAIPVVTLEDTPLNLLLNASDADGDTLSYQVVAGPLHGTLSGTGANRTYSPNANYFGTDSFSFKVNDGTDDSNVVVVQLTIDPVNDAPVTASASMNAVEEVATPVPFAATDVENDSLTFEVLSGPEHGTLSGAWPNLFYTPALNYNGPDSITYRAYDGQDYGNVATISITVTPANDPPVATSQSVSAVEDTARAITLSGSDIDGDPLTFTVVTLPSKGTLSGAGASLTYTPAANTNGIDTFTFKVNDGAVDSNIATVTIDVAPVNDNPTAVNDAASAVTWVSTVIDVLTNDSDVDGHPLTITSVGPASNGTVSLTGNTVTYRSTKNFSGTATFPYTISDGNGGTASATVTVTVGSANGAPRAARDNYNVAAGVSVMLPVLANDSDPNGDPLTITSVTASVPAGATIAISPGGQSLQFVGPASRTAYRFTYTISDGRGGTDTADVTARTN